MSKLSERIDGELSGVTFSQEARAEVLRRASSPWQRLGRLLCREIEIPAAPALAVCLALVITCSAWASRLAVDSSEITRIQYQIITTEGGGGHD